MKRRNFFTSLCGLITLPFFKFKKEPKKIVPKSLTYFDGRVHSVLYTRNPENTNNILCKSVWIINDNNDLLEAKVGYGWHLLPNEEVCARLSNNEWKIDEWIRPLNTKASINRS